MESQGSESIVVLGAKPSAALPVLADCVIAVNGAVETAVQYRERYDSKIIGLVHVIALRKYVHIQEALKKAVPDQMLVYGDDPEIVSYIHDVLGLSEMDVICVSTKERLSIMGEILGLRRLLVTMERIKTRGIRHFLRRALPDILLHRNKNWLVHSTGLDAIMYVMKQFPECTVIAAGMSLQTAARANNKGEFTNKTALADRGTMKHWPRSRRKQVYTTDSVMSELGDVPMWEGETFQSNS